MSGFRWRDFPDLAELLCRQSALGLDEARHRSAVSRAYYATLNLSKGKAFRRGWTPLGRGRDRRDLVGWLSRQGLRLQARQLEAMRRVRNGAGYDLHSAPGGGRSAGAGRMLGMARQILADLERLLPDG